MYKRVEFFNHYHNGDIHVSREFVKRIIAAAKESRPNTTFAYSHRNAINLLADIPELMIGDAQTTLSRLSDKTELVIDGDTLYLNTWYACHAPTFQKLGITIDCLYANFVKHSGMLCGLPLDHLSQDLQDWFPSIDYSYYQINKAKEWLTHHPERKVFISNGPVLSHQAVNFSFGEIVRELADAYPDTTFILSNSEFLGKHRSNIVFSQGIIQNGDFDLNENAYLASHCDLVIGRASGAFSFAMTRENLFGGKPRFLCFSNLFREGKQFWTGEVFQNVRYSNFQSVPNLSDLPTIKAVIEQNLCSL